MVAPVVGDWVPLEVPEPPPPDPVPSAAWIVLVGRLPATVGSDSKYSVTPELPGGAKLGPRALTAAGAARDPAARASPARQPAAVNVERTVSLSTSLAAEH